MAPRLSTQLLLGLMVSLGTPATLAWSAPNTKPAARAAKAAPKARTTAKKAPQPRTAPKARKPGVRKIAPAARAKAKPAPTVRKAQPVRKAPVVAKRTAPKPAARPAARTAPVARKAPAARPNPTARKAPVARAVAKPAPRRQASKPKAPARPAARTAPAARRAVVRKPAARPIVGNAVSEVSNNYQMFFRHKQVGEFTRTEKLRNDQMVEVLNNSTMNIQMIFTTVKAKNKSRCVYDKQGRLVEFSITSKVRGKTTSFKGKRDASGLTITQTQGKKSKTRFFPRGSFQGTSLDYRFPKAHPGIQLRRNYLIIPRMSIVEQKLTYRQAQSQTVFGRKQPLFELTIESGDAKHRNKGTVLVTQEGQMVASRMPGRLGVVEIRLKK